MSTLDTLIYLNMHRTPHPSECKEEKEKHTQNLKEAAALEDQSLSEDKHCEAQRISDRTAAAEARMGSKQAVTGKVSESSCICALMVYICLLGTTGTVAPGIVKAICSPERCETKQKSHSSQRPNDSNNEETFGEQLE
jgi:cytochrome c-type biogenesis protein CcmH/NrfG